MDINIGNFPKTPISVNFKGTFDNMILFAVVSMAKKPIQKFHFKP